MGIEDLIIWYQKKIGAYDKQQWERTVEQRIVDGLNHIQLKTAKPKTELIDLDLVRGSSFTKAKPKHGFLTVARLSTLRIFLLPVYSKWWVQQTSGKIFSVLLLVYLLQLFTVAIYTYNSNTDISQTVPISEILVPMIMMWVLSFIHSQIVATIPSSEKPPSSTQLKYRKSYRSSRRSRKLNTVKEQSDDSLGNKKSRRWPGGRLSWKQKENLNNKSHKSVLFQEDDVIIPNVAEADTSGVGSIGVSNLRLRRVNNKVPVDDDGFESLNGNGSSHSDNGEDKKSFSGLRCHAWVRTVQDTHGSPDRRQSAPDLRFNSSDNSDSDTYTTLPLLTRPRVESVCDTDEEEGECETLSSPETLGSGRIEATVSGTEWVGVTTNSEDCSYSSEMSESDAQVGGFDIDAPPNSILSPHIGASDRVSCTIWDTKDIKKADLSVIEISSVIIATVEKMPESMDYFYIGLFIATILSFLPIMCRLCCNAIDTSNLDELQLSLIEISHLVLAKFSGSFWDVLDALLGTTTWERTIMLTAAFQRWILGSALFFLLAVAERSFKQRYLYAKLFSHLTSTRKARKSELPHFRLNKVRNIKTWLSVRSYLKKRGPQRSVDVIVSSAFIVTLLLLSFLCMELLKESFVLNSQYNLEIMIWSVGLGILILRFMTLGVKINKKYRNLSVLITEQINLYLQIEQKPHKKEELMVANSVLKLAADLLKELESQFKILGLSANPFLYNITKVVILSALSGVLSEILGFKLKLHKIKIK